MSGALRSFERGELGRNVVPPLVNDEEILERLIDLHDEGISADGAEVAERVIELPTIALVGGLDVAVLENPVAQSFAAAVVDNQPVTALAGCNELLPVETALGRLEGEDAHGEASDYNNDSDGTQTIVFRKEQDRSNDDHNDSTDHEYPKHVDSFFAVVCP